MRTSFADRFENYEPSDTDKLDVEALQTLRAPVRCSCAPKADSGSPSASPEPWLS